MCNQHAKVILAAIELMLRTDALLPSGDDFDAAMAVLRRQAALVPSEGPQDRLSAPG